MHAIGGVLRPRAMDIMHKRSDFILIIFRMAFSSFKGEYLAANEANEKKRIKMHMILWSRVDYQMEIKLNA